MSDNMPSLVPQAFVAGPFACVDPASSKIYTLFYTKYNPIEITKVYITNDKAIGADGTNFMHFTIESGSDNTGGTTLFSANTSAGALAAGTLYELTETEGTVAIDQYVVLNAQEGGTAEMAQDTMVILYFVEGNPASE